MFCKIIGYPLANPRSVKLWRNFFKKKKLKIKMGKLEVNSKNFNKEFSKMTKDKNFLASAITMPYKKKIFKKVIIANQNTKYAKSINFIIKKKKKIYGYNTDIEGALHSIKKVKKKKIIIFGYGGTGEALTRTLSNRFINSKIIVISNKKKPNNQFSSNVSFLKKKNFRSLMDSDLFINCSPLGSKIKKGCANLSPLKQIHFYKLKNRTVIFDVVYDNKVTPLSILAKKNKSTYIGGKLMNTIQANYALDIIYKYVSKNK